MYVELCLIMIMDDIINDQIGNNQTDFVALYENLTYDESLKCSDSPFDNLNILSEYYTPEEFNLKKL